MSELPKRRLPMLQEPEVAREEDEHRPAWHWVAIGCIGTFVGWYPLALGVNALVSRGSFPPVLLVVSNAAAFALACFSGGFVVGRFGARATIREAAASGVATAVLAWGFAALGGESVLVWGLLLALVATLGGGAAYAGGRVGVRVRTRR